MSWHNQPADPRVELWHQLALDGFGTVLMLTLLDSETACR
jgi:hypothetical protein